MEDGRGIEDATPEERRRLPLLIEVLSRRTLAPVDLFSFYIYMRDQQRSVDYLDFWLDVSQHMSLCRHYVRELRRSVLYETPDIEKAGSKRSSALLHDFDAVEKASVNGNGNGKRSFQSERSQDQRVSALLRSESADDTRSNKHSVQKSSESNREDSSQSRSRSRSGTASTHGTNTTHSQRHPRPSFMSSKVDDSSSPATRDHDESPQHTINRADIRASAEKILYIFLLPGAEREIILPQAVLSSITEAIEDHGRDDPEIFDDAKEYVFLAMERDAFPGFLRSKALGNLVPPSLMARLVVGLLSIFAAFWAGFTLIFLDYNRSTRCWLILPFTIAVYALIAHQYTLDPVLAIAGYSEYTFCNFQKMREPFVKQLLMKRAIMVMGWIVLIDVALICLFVLVPGKRL